MDRLRKSFRSSFRRKSQHEQDTEIRTVTWPKDEAAVKTNTCSFEVKYLGSVEVFESRGMQICEEALKLLKNSKRQTIRGTLHVSGDGMRVVDKETKGLVLDQTIEKVSFCAPDRSYDKGFSYICRDGTTRRWMCHGFLSASGDTGERLSHAVGCAFAICLEKKQMREKESVQYHYNKKENVFTRFGSFQQGTIQDRLKDPQEFKPGLEHPKPTEPVANPNALARPRPSDMYLRQASMRGGGRMPVASSSLFKRQYSLRLDELPSTLSRQKSLYTNDAESSSGQGCTTIQEDSLSPTKEISSFASPPVIGASSGPSSIQPYNRYQAPLTAPPRLEAGAPTRLEAGAPPLLESGGCKIAFTSTPLPKTRPSTVDSPFFPCSGPVSLPINLSVFNPVSILTEEIPTELPPPILSPTSGSTLSPVNKGVALCKPTSTVSPSHNILPVFHTGALDKTETNNVRDSSEAILPGINGQSVFNPFISQDPFTSIGVSLSESKVGILPPLPPRICNPPPLPSRLTGSTQPASLPPTLGSLLSPVGADSSQRSLESLGSTSRGADARCSGVVRGCQAISAPGSTSSRGSSQASGIIREGFNPWDNVPDQPIVRCLPGGSVSKVGGRPVSMIECESKSKAAHQLSSASTMERGYSLEAVIAAGTTNHDQENKTNLFILPGESDSSSGFLRDPFDSDWADTALKAKPSPKHYQDKNENSFKSFELHL